MKTFRPTFVLIGLFFAGLLVLWWLEDSGVPTEAQRRGRLNRVLPDLIDVPETAITRLEILRGGETLAFERKGTDRWQMTRPLDVAADSTIVETLIGNLKNLRKSPDSGTITAPPESYGLAPPGAVVRLWGDAGSAATSQPRLLAGARDRQHGSRPVFRAAGRHGGNRSGRQEAAGCCKSAAARMAADQPHPRAELSDLEPGDSSGCSELESRPRRRGPLAPLRAGQRAGQWSQDRKRDRRALVDPGPRWPERIHRR